MQKSLILSGLLIVAALTSCEFKEEFQPVEERIFRGVLEQLEPDASTKAYATKKETGGYDIFWNRDDRLSIFYDKTYNRQYRVTDRDGSQAATFERVGTDPANIAEQNIETGYDYAIYPYHLDNRCFSDGTLTVVIPENQTFYDDARGVGVRPLMVAQDPDGDFMFMHAATYVGIALKGAGVSVSSISFQGNNSELLAGYPMVTFEDGVPVMSFDPLDLDNSSIVTMQLATPVELEADNAKTFWLTLIPGTLSKGFTLTVTDANGGVYQRVVSSSIALERRAFNTIKTTVKMTYHAGSVSLNKEELALNVGEDETLVATVLPENAADKTVTWSSNNPDVATVDQNGKVTAVAAGDAVITVTTNDGNKTASCAVTVNDVISYRLAIDPSSAEINAGATKTFKAMLFTTTNNVENSGVEVNATSWTSSSTAVATIANGTATGVAGGETTITAKYTPSGSSELTATATLTVNDVISYSVAISPTENAKVAVDKTFKFTLTLTTTTNGTGVDSDVTEAATWTSSNTAFATISAGTATGVAIGEVTITAKYRTPDGVEKTLTAPLTVTEDPNHAGDPIPIGGEENL